VKKGNRSLMNSLQLLNRIKKWWDSLLPFPHFCDLQRFDLQRFDVIISAFIGLRLIP